MPEVIKPHKFSALWRTNFLSAATPTCFCTLAVLLISHCTPVFERQALNALLVGGCFTLPLVFASFLTQFLISRFSTRNVITCCKLGEVLLLLLGSVSLGQLPHLGAIPALVLIFLLGLDFGIYSPAFKAYVAEKVPQHLLSRIGGYAQGAVYFGIILGTVSGVLFVHLSEICPQIPVGYSTWFCVAIAAWSLVISTRLSPNLPAKPGVRFRELPRQWLDTFRHQPRYKELLLTGIGESYIGGSIIFVAAMAIEYITINFNAGESDPVHFYSIMASPILGAALGCISAGLLSRQNVEIGLVPPATLAMTIAAVLIGVLPYYSDFYIETGLLALLLFIFGFFSGVMQIPVLTYQEYFVKPELRSAFFAWFYLPFGLALFCGIGLSFVMYIFNIPIFPVALALAILTLILAVTTFALMPQFLLRMFMKLLMMTVYRLRINNIEGIPAQGPALLVSNRASFVDMLFISACTTRPVRFMMDETYYHYPILHYWFKTVGFIEVPVGKPKKLQQMFEYSRELFRKGELICVFPENDITRNGIMSSFKDDLSVLLPPEIDVPLIPLRIGMTWGSVFSCYLGKFKLRWPDEVRHPASINIGQPLPRCSNAYEIRLALSELAAENELVPTPEERPLHAQYAFVTQKHPWRRTVREFNGTEWQAPCNLQLLTEAIMLSRYLRQICAPSEEYIGVMLPNGVNTCAALLGVQFADRAPAVLNYTASLEAENAGVVNAGIKHIITSRRFLDKLQRSPRPEMVFIEDIYAKFSRWQRWFWSVAVLLLPNPELLKLLSPLSWTDVNRVGILIFSSGSTGIPKGVMLSHHNITGDAHAVIDSIGWNKNDRVLGNLPLFHSFGVNVCFWIPLITGTEVVLIPNALDAKASCAAIRERQISILFSTPGFLQIYMRGGKPEDFASLRLTITGAEKLRDDIADRFFELTGLVIAEGYGCTELSPIVSINLAHTIEKLGAQVIKRGSIGAPLTGICGKIVDPVTFELRPENADGLLIVKGANVMLGYLNNPEKTREVIKDGWYLTGDIAHMDRYGQITITGRVSRFSKIAGEMVPHELVEREIGNILLPDHRVIAISSGSDARRGEKLIVFYCDQELVKPAELVKQLREKNIPNLWIPRVENFVYVSHLPMLGSGKLDLAMLNKWAQKFSNGEPLE